MWFFVPTWHGCSDTFFVAKESNQRPQFLPLLSLMPKKVTKERHPGSLESPQQIQRFKARAKLAGR
jgi:hypothetical protein